jgi:hypothetical protein
MQTRWPVCLEATAQRRLSPTMGSAALDPFERLTKHPRLTGKVSTHLTNHGLGGTSSQPTKNMTSPLITKSSIPTMNTKGLTNHGLGGVDAQVVVREDAVDGAILSHVARL